MVLLELPTNATRLSHLFQFANTATTVGGVGWFGVSIVVMVWVIVFFALKNYEASKAYVVACLVSFVVSVLLRVMVLVSDMVVAILVVMLALGVVWLFKSPSTAV